MRLRIAAVFAMAALYVALLAGSITTASAQRFDRDRDWDNDHVRYYHQHTYGHYDNGNHYGYYHHRYYRHVTVTPAPVTVWTTPPPGWYWHSRDWYYSHSYAWRHAHPYHMGPHGGFYLQF